MKNVAYSRLGNMLHLDIQQGKEAMKTSEFEKILERLLRARGYQRCILKGVAN